MVIIHDHACSTAVKLYGIYDSTKKCCSSPNHHPWRPTVTPEQPLQGFKDTCNKDKGSII
jgi:hypothetical protein